MKLLRLILLPLSMIWYAASRIRTWLYVSGRCRRHRFPLPVFSGGQYFHGGTGKSPHTELLARQMLTEGRKTRRAEPGIRTENQRLPPGFHPFAVQRSGRRTPDDQTLPCPPPRSPCAKTGPKASVGYWKRKNRNSWSWMMLTSTCAWKRPAISCSRPLPSLLPRTYYCRPATCGKAATPPNGPPA